MENVIKYTFTKSPLAKALPYFICFLLLNPFFSLSQEYSYLLSQKKIDSMLSETNDTILFDNLWDLNFYYADRDKDSAQLMLKRINTLTNEAFRSDLRRLAILNDIKAFHSYNAGRYDSVAYYLATSIEKHKQGGDLLNAASSYSNLGNLAFDFYELDSAESVWKKALEMYNQLGDSLEEAKGNVLQNLGSLYFEKGEYVKSVNYKYRSLDLFKEARIQDKVLSTLVSIGWDQITFKKYIKARELYAKAEKIALESKDLNELSHIYRSYSIISRAQGKIDSIFHYDSLAYVISLKLGNTLKILDDRLFLANTYLELGKIKKAFSLAHLNLKEIADLNESEAFKIHLKNSTLLIMANTSLAQGDRSEAMKYFGQIDYHPEDNFHWNSKELLLTNLYETSRKLGLFESSLQYHELLKVHQDSLLNLDNSIAINEIEAKYETEKKEREIASLQQTAEIQSLELDKKNNQFVIGSLVVVVFAVGGFLYYRQYKIKRDKASLELEQRFLRSQLNPHFIFNSMGAIQNYLLTENTEKATHYMSMFSQLMRQILEHSREEFIPLSEEIDMLNNYLKLQELRFSKSFTFKIDLDEELDEDTVGIPPMFAQPFIENALEHGLFKKGDHNEVRIKFSKSANDLIELEILDSGVGIKEALVKVKEHQSLATRITNERLEKMRISNKAKVGFDAENIMDETGKVQGYRVRLSLPSKLIAA